DISIMVPCNMEHALCESRDNVVAPFHSVCAHLKGRVAREPDAGYYLVRLGRVFARRRMERARWEAGAHARVRGHGVGGVQSRALVGGAAAARSATGRTHQPSAPAAPPPRCQ